MVARWPIDSQALLSYLAQDEGIEVGKPGYTTSAPFVSKAKFVIAALPGYFCL